MKSSLSLSFSHTLSPFLTLASLSLSPFFSLSLREGLRRWSVRRGEDFTRRWGDGKTCPSNVSHWSQRGPDPKATSNLTLSFDLLSPLLTGNSATPCSLFKPLWVCVCVIFWPSQTPTEQKCGHLSRHRRSEVLLRCQNVVHWLDITVSCGGSVSTSHLQLWLLSVLTRLDRPQVSRGCGSIQGLLTSGLIFPPFFKKMLCLRSQCGLNGVPTQRVLEEEEREEEGGDGALWRLSVCCVYCQTLKDLQALSSALSST